MKMGLELGIWKNYKLSEKGVGISDKEAGNFDQKAELSARGSVFD